MSFMFIVDELLLFGIAIASAWVVRQTVCSQDKYSVPFRFFLVGLSGTSAIKLYQHYIENFEPALVDTVQDFFLFGVLMTVIIFHKDRFHKL